MKLTEIKRSDPVKMKLHWLKWKLARWRPALYRQLDRLRKGFVYSVKRPLWHVVYDGSHFIYYGNGKLIAYDNSKWEAAAQDTTWKVIDGDIHMWFNGKWTLQREEFQRAFRSYLSISILN